MAMLGSEGCALQKGFVDLRCCHGGQGVVQAQAAAEGNSPTTVRVYAMPMAPVTTKGNAERCPRSGLTPEAMLMPEGQAPNRATHTK